MIRRRLIAPIVVLLCAAAVAVPRVAVAQGPAQPRTPTLALVGGNSGVPATKAILDLGGGANAVVAVIIHRQASGDSTVNLWRKVGAKEVIPVHVKDAATSGPLLERASIIFFAGGGQSELYDAIKDTPMPGIIRTQYAKGVIVGGTSAGAAVMSKIMTTGDADLQSMTAGRTQWSEGLGMWPGVIIEQHTLKRQRLARFFSLVMDHPDHLGVAMDEGTGVVVTGRTMRVIGVSSVTVLDARRAEVPKQVDGKPSTGRNMILHVLTDGMTFDLGDAAPGGGVTR